MMFQLENGQDFGLLENHRRLGLHMQLCCRHNVVFQMDECCFRRVGYAPLGIQPMTYTCWIWRMTSSSGIAHIVVQGQGPGPRYGHAMDLVAQRYPVTGNDGKRVLSDAWALDTAQKPYTWQKLNPEGMQQLVPGLMACVCSVCGGRDTSAHVAIDLPLADAYGLLMHRNGQWEWTLAPGVSPSPRYHHATVFVGATLHVTGGSIRGGRAVEGEGAIAILDTAAGVWLDRKGLVTSRCNKRANRSDLSLESMRIVMLLHLLVSGFIFFGA